MELGLLLVMRNLLGKPCLRVRVQAGRGRGRLAVWNGRRRVKKLLVLLILLAREKQAVLVIHLIGIIGCVAYNQSMVAGAT